MSNESMSLKLIKVGNLVDGRSGRPRKHMAVAVEGSRITRVGSQAELGPLENQGAEVLDFPRATMVPGLVDCHTHTNMPGTGILVNQVDEDGDDIHLLEGVKSARMALESGVTTIRENGGWNKVAFSLKEGIRRQIVPGPRVIASGNPITMTGGHCWMMGAQADGPDGVRKAVRKMIHNGADFIKVMTSGGSTRGTMPERASYSLEELAALVDEAHLRGKLVAGHAIAVQAIVNCLDAGVDMIVHCSFMQPDGSVKFDPRIGERVAASGAWVNPTLHVRRAETLRLEEKRETEKLTAEEQQALDANLKDVEDRMEVCRQLVSAGARFIGGSDCGWGAYPFGQFHRELKAMEHTGLPTKQALLSGTRDAADALGVLDKVGTIEPGKEADLLLVDGDPTREINDLTRVAAVFQAGQRVG